MAEVMLTATSDLAGKTVVESKFRTRFGLTMIGLRHGDTAQDGNLQDEKLGIGDTLLVIGLWKSIQRLRTDTANLIVLNLPAEPYPFAMIVALAAAAAFMTPISSPVNTLVVGPGNYTFGDFVKVGVPFTLVVMVVCVVMVPILLPLYK